MLLQLSLPARASGFRPALAGLLAWSIASGCYSAELVGRVVRVHDGDTLTVLVEQRRQVKIRIDSIDAPERKQAFGTRSREALAALCGGEHVVVQTSGQDRYGRHIGRVTCRGKDASTEQVRAGMAWVYVKYARPDDPMYPLEAEARAARRGLWAHPAVPPWVWRKQ